MLLAVEHEPVAQVESVHVVEGTPPLLNLHLVLAPSAGALTVIVQLGEAMTLCVSPSAGIVVGDTLQPVRVKVPAGEPA